MKWTEISNQPDTKRFEILSEELKLSQCDNIFVPTDLPQEFKDENFFINDDNGDRFRLYVNQLKKDFDQIRVGGFFKEKMDYLSSEYPAELMQIKTLDSIVKTDGRWWPRNQLYHGLIHLLSHDIKHVDFSAPILVVGANSDSKTIISALIKMGFSTFNITDVDVEKCRAQVLDLQRNYFSSHFEMTEIGYVTQLPNIYSIGVNALRGELDETTKMAVIYFNFLPKGAFWIESTPRESSALADEAVSFGFNVRLGGELNASLDFVWAKSVLNCEIDLPRLKESYKAKLFIK